MAIEFPVTIKSIKSSDDAPLHQRLLLGGQCGDMVAVRPCGEEYERKTFLGVLLGEMALAQGVSFDPDTGELTMHRSMYNPAIFIPDRNAVVFGCGSWWGRIQSEEQLRDITDANIANVWYVKALQQLEK